MDKLLRKLEEQEKVIDELTQKVLEFQEYFNDRLDQLELKIEALLPHCGRLD